MYARKKIEPFGSIAYVALNREDWKKLGMRYGLYEWEAGPSSAGRTEDLVGYPHNQHHVIVWIDLEQDYDDAYIINTITHESVHASGLILKQIGQEHDGLSETHAYLAGFIAEWMYKEWQKTKQNKGKK